MNLTAPRNADFLTREDRQIGPTLTQRCIREVCAWLLVSALFGAGVGWVITS